MKVRCKGCGRVVKVPRSGWPSTCEACGSPLTTGQQPAPLPAPPPASDLEAPGKGQLPTQDTAARNIGCLIMGALLFGIPMLIAAITEGDNATYWVLAIAALIALIPLGVWFERNTIRRR